MRENHVLLLVHALKAIEYRLIKATNESKGEFGEFRISPDTRNPNEIINHMFDLTSKTKTMILEGHFNIPPAQLLDFENEKERLVKGLQELQGVIGTNDIDIDSSKKLLQGPILDISTHVGQISMLNGLHGNKIPKESYYDSKI